MKFPLFSKRERTLPAAKDPQAEMEKLLAQAFRVLGELCGKLADGIEQNRLQRQGYREQERFLERVDKKA